jgi:hypothetical protein
MRLQGGGGKIQTKATLEKIIIHFVVLYASAQIAQHKPGRGWSTL